VNVVMKSEREQLYWNMISGREIDRVAEGGSMNPAASIQWISQNPDARGPVKGERSMDAE
jgi:hypothetical protein